MAEKYPNKLKILSDDETSLRKIYAASNIALIFNNSNTNLVELKNSLAYGVVPVALSNQILKDFDPVKEAGNAFLFEKENKWSLFAALVRALENYRFVYDWENLELAAMETLEQPEE